MQFRNRSLLRAYIPCLAVALALNVFIFHRVHFKAVGSVLSTMRVDWFLMAMLLFGFLFLPAAVRWHVALKANDSSVDLPTSFRFSLIGHFFYMILFGVAGGDATKSALYARWNRLPLVKIFAASSLDRLMGFAGLALFTAFAFALAATHAGLTDAAPLALRWPNRWWLLFIPAALVLLIYSVRSRASSIQFFLRNLSESAGKLLRSPGNLTAGIFSAVLVQAALSGVLAVSLQAVSRQAIPWLQLAWTFPVISVASALPITVAGLGVRETVAVVLLSWYHVPTSDAVAASLLTAFISLVWMMVGAAILWWEASSRESEFRLKNFSNLISRRKIETV